MKNFNLITIRRICYVQIKIIIIIEIVTKINWSLSALHHPSIELLEKWLREWLSCWDQTCVAHHCANYIWINVWAWSSVLNVALTILGSGLRGNSEWAGSVANAEWELLHAWSLMLAGKPLAVLLSIYFEVILMFITEFFHHVFNVFHAFGAISHRLSWVIGVAARSVEILKDFDVETYGKLDFFSSSKKEESWDPQLITYFDTFAWANLVFPLAWHDFSICSWDFDPSVQASLVMHVAQLSTKGSIPSNGAVIWTLSTWKAFFRPSMDFCIELTLIFDNCVLLFNSKPWLLTFDSWMVKNLFGPVSEIRAARN